MKLLILLISLLFVATILFLTRFFLLNNSSPNGTGIDIPNRRPVAIVVASSSGSMKYQSVDSEGAVLGDTDLPDLPKIYSQYIDGSDIKNTLKIIDKITSSGFSVKVIKIDPPKNLLIEGIYKVYFSLDKNIDIQLASLQLILNQAKIDSEKVDYIDLRFEKPVIKDK